MIDNFERDLELTMSLLDKRYRIYIEKNGEKFYYIFVNDKMIKFDDKESSRVFKPLEVLYYYEYLKQIEIFEILQIEEAEE